MKAFFLALTLINASPEEQDLMLADMYDADPRLAYEVLYVADELGADTNELAIVIAIIADSTGCPTVAGDQYVAWPQTYDRSGNETVKWIPGINAKSNTISPNYGGFRRWYIITNCRAELDGIPNQMALMQSF